MEVAVAYGLLVQTLNGPLLKHGVQAETAEEARLAAASAVLLSAAAAAASASASAAVSAGAPAAL